MFRFADRQADGQSKRISPLAFVTAWISTEAGVNSRESLGSDANLIKMPFQLGAAIFSPSQIDVVAQRKGFFEVHESQGLAFHEVEKNPVFVSEGSHHMESERELVLFL